MSLDLPLLPAGIYEHYKGDQYLVLGYSSDSTNRPCTCDAVMGIPHEAYCLRLIGDQIYVAYISLRQITDSKPRLSWHVREQSQFHEVVCWKRGCHSWGMTPMANCFKADHVGRHPQPRFSYVRPA